jgi:hypothetical protein
MLVFPKYRRSAGLVSDIASATRSNIFLTWPPNNCARIGLSFVIVFTFGHFFLALQQQGGIVDGVIGGGGHDVIGRGQFDYAGYIIV